MIDSARVIVTFNCNRMCGYCANKSKYAIEGAEELTSVVSLGAYQNIVITGGEPLLDIQRTMKIIDDICGVSPTRHIYLYTALWRKKFEPILRVINGITFTLHETIDWKDEFGFLWLQKALMHYEYSRRLRISGRLQKSLSVAPYVWTNIEMVHFDYPERCRVPVNEKLFILKGY